MLGYCLGYCMSFFIHDGLRNNSISHRTRRSSYRNFLQKEYVKKVLAMISIPLRAERIASGSERGCFATNEIHILKAHK